MSHTCRFLFAADTPPLSWARLRGFFLLATFLFNGLAGLGPTWAVAEEEVPECPAFLNEWWQWVQRADQKRGAEPERRIKQLTLFNRKPDSGSLLESADLTRPLPITLPDGRRTKFLFASGTYAFEVRDGDMKNLLRGGPRGRRRVPIEFRFADGRRMTGPYHSGSLPWDFVVIEWPVGNFEKGDPLRIEAEAEGRKVVQIGYGGTMVQPHLLAGASTDARKKPVQVPGANYNPTRTRHAFKVQFTEEKIVATDLGCVFGHMPSVALEWLSEEHEHGYGGRPFLNADGTPYVDGYGKGWMEYERVVSEEIRYEDGRVVVLHKEGGKLTLTDRDGTALTQLPPGAIRRRVPTLTEIFARRLRTPTRTYRKGERLADGKPADEEIKLMSVRPNRSPDALPGMPLAEPYPGAGRGEGEGDLVEGGNHSFLSPTDFVGMEAERPLRGFHILAASSGNFVDRNTADGKGYGAIVGVRTEKEGPLGLYEPLTQLTPDTPDFKNFTAFLGWKYGIIWGPARPDFFRDDDTGHWWMVVHGVPVHTLNPRLPRGGWPNGPADFEKYARAGWLVPVHWILKDRKPWLVVENPSL